MSSEQLIVELEKIFRKEEHYYFLNYINKNIGVFISAISIISAIVLFVARAISYLLVSEKYRFWNLDEGFLVEDDKTFLKLGVYVLFFLLITLLNSFAQRYVYRWELYHCEIYLFDKIVKNQTKELIKIEKKITGMDQSIGFVENDNDSINEDMFDSPLKLKTEYANLKKNNTSIKKDIWKLRINLWSRFLLVMLVVLIASFILQLLLGVENWNNGVISLIVSSAIISLIIMFTAFLSAFLEIRMTIKTTLKRSFANNKINWDSDYILPVTEWLKSNIDEQEKRSIKVFFSDRSLKTLLMSIISTTLIMTIFLQLYMNYSLKRMDIFYVYREDQQDYVMLINDGEKYIFSECDINEDELIIDTNKIIVRNDPVSLEKVQFECVERKQYSELSDKNDLQQNEES